jgi:hypothetical protein
LTSRQIAEWLLRIAVLGLVVIFMVFGRLYCQSADHFRRGEELFGKDDLRGAMIEFEATITNYTPLINGRVERAANRLLEIGARYEAADSLVLAFRAYQSLTSSLTAIESIVEPYKELKNKGRTELARARKQLDENERLRWQTYEADSTAGKK